MLEEPELDEPDESDELSSSLSDEVVMVPESLPSSTATVASMAATASNPLASGRLPALTGASTVGLTGRLGVTGPGVSWCKPGESKDVATLDVLLMVDRAGDACSS